MPEACFQRTILITGATDGVGRQTASDLAAHPDNFVVIHGRTEEKCEAAKESIVRETGNKTNVAFIAADFSDMHEIHHFTDEVRRRFPTLNILLCNAAILHARRAESKDGHELTLQINYLAHFVICRSLIDVLSRNRAPKIYVVGSALHSWTSIDWTDIMALKDYEKYLQYSRTKLMCHMMGFALHRRMVLSGSPVAVNVVELGKEKEPNNNKIRTTSALSTSMSTLSICKAAGNLVQLIENESLSRLSGKYLDASGKQLRSGADATDERLQERLWQLSTELCGNA